MIRCGLASVSYRNADPKSVIERAKSAKLGGIEWSADTHAPHGDLKTAERLMMETLRAGLTVSCYGSFYRIGSDASPCFDAVLETALRLQAPTLRVWGPSSGSVAPEEVAREGASLAEEAGRRGITVCIEPHEKSAVRDYAVLTEVLEIAGHPFLKACWAQLPGCGPKEAETAARELGPRIGIVHVRNWSSGYARMPLDAEDACWAAIAGMAERGGDSDLDRWALIEYLADERPETLRCEAEALARRIGT